MQQQIVRLTSENLDKDKKIKELNIRLETLRKSSAMKNGNSKELETLMN